MPNEEELEYEYYGCYRCGTIEGNVANTPEGHVYCAECGEDSIMTLTKALDLINQLYEDGRLYPHDVNGEDLSQDEDITEGNLEESYEDNYDEEE